MKEQFKRAYRAFRTNCPAPDWAAFDANMHGVPLAAAVAAGKCYCWRGR